MAGIKLFPWENEIDRYANAIPDYMRPSSVPFAVVFEGALTSYVCDRIQDRTETWEPYTNHSCDATSREIHNHEVLRPIEDIARYLNAKFFDYDLDPGQHSWLQTYRQGQSYDRHMDGAPGQTRKLTAVAMLSDSSDYSGGDLKLDVDPWFCAVPRARGTVVLFQHWVPHLVTPVLHGLRQTINMGFWGPPFK